MLFHKFFQKNRSSPLFFYEILVSFRPRNCEVAQKPQRKHKQREQADQQKLGVLRSSRDSATTWSPELWMKSGAGILGLGYFYPPLHKPLPYTSWMVTTDIYAGWAALQLHPFRVFQVWSQCAILEPRAQTSTPAVSQWHCQQHRTFVLTPSPLVASAWKSKQFPHPPGNIPMRKFLLPSHNHRASHIILPPLASGHFPICLGSCARPSPSPQENLWLHSFSSNSSYLSSTLRAHWLRPQFSKEFYHMLKWSWLRPSVCF